MAHRRLAILDLSVGASQPMTTPDGRYTLCFNGEIYNFRELRAELESTGVQFATTSDTEVILQLYARDGQQCVKQLRGMFAFALWDGEKQTALLARDPLGIKPLYIHRGEGVLAFASELRALAQSQLFTPTLNPLAVQHYFETGSVPEPLTLIQEAAMLEAGHTLEWQAGQTRIQPYWQLLLPASPPTTGNAIAVTREALLDTVKHHFVSDVPVGIFLSGGIDSTALLALANETGHQGCSTFSIAVDEAAADESAIARQTATHFGSDHHEMRLDARMAETLFAQFLIHLDQPTIDGFNTFTVSKLASMHGMKVVLSGLGGDEVFAGYASFTKIPQMYRWHGLIRAIPGICPLLDRNKSKHQRLADFLRSPGRVEDAYASLRGIFSQREAAQLTAWITGVEMAQVESGKRKAEGSIADQVSVLELTRYMRNQLLRDSDVMSMAHGLELRVPFVDRTLLESVASIPAAIRLQAGKRLLTQAVPEVPTWVVNQKKRGFLFPFEQWLGSAWGEVFQAASSSAPVPVSTWYQKWSLFVLRHVMTQLGL
jgi:asparagine synthase (glutamine-hydrolysing)